MYFYKNQIVNKELLCGFVVAAALMSACGGPQPSGHKTLNTPKKRPVTEQSRTTTITGVAKNAKAGAVVVLGDGNPVYVQGLDEWPDSTLDRNVEVRGVLVDEKMIPDPKVDKNGAISQGAMGDQTVIKKARWMVVDR